MRDASTIVTRYICEFACNVYSKALSTENLQAVFKRSGIFPISPGKIPMESLLPSTVYTEPQDTGNQATIEGGIELPAPETVKEKAVKMLKRKEQKLKETKQKNKGKLRKIN